VKISVAKSLLASNKTDAVIEHNGKTLSFTIAGIYRNSIVYDYDIFEFLNEYWKTLPQSQLDQIFELYTQARNAFNSIVNKSQLNYTLNAIVIELVKLHDFESVYEWVIYKSTIRIPDNFETEYKYSYDKQGSREQTYIRSDYTKLIAMIVVLKSIVPIWGQYMNSEQTPVKSIFKEFYAFQLLHGSSIYNSEPMEKLAIYVKAALAANKENTSAIISGISTEDYHYWVLATVVINRLCDGDIRGLDPKNNIITYIYKFIYQKNQSFESNNSKSIKEKTKTDYDGEQGDKNSSIERYKLKHDISIGEIVELTYSVRDLHSIAFALAPHTMTEELFSSCLMSSQKLLQKELHIPQLNILRWVFRSVISSKGIMYLDKHTIVGCLGVLEAVLYSLGYEFLALVSTAYIENEQNEIFLSSTDSRARIPKDILASLDVLFPYQQISGGFKTGIKYTNPAVAAIDMTVDRLSKHSWIATASEDKIEKINGLKENTRLTIPYDIKIQLAKLVLHFASRGKPIVVPPSRDKL
jgi:hypothetical protein